MRNIENIQSSMPSNNLTIDKVTPELAAQIVKHFILPMFESDSRKALKRKHTRLLSAVVSPAQRSLDVPKIAESVS